jgi:DNA-binding PadR family transcriptional regulator
LTQQHADLGADLKDNSLEQELREIASGITKLVTRGLANAKFSMTNSNQDFDLKLATMAALLNGPKNGFGIKREITLLSGGSQRPSQAEVEVEIQALISARFVKVSIKDDLRLYELTKAGKVELNAREQSLNSESQSGEAAKTAETKHSTSWASPELIEAGKTLTKTIASAVANQSEEIQAEVAKVLKQANARIQERLSKKS